MYIKIFTRLSFIIILFLTTENIQAQALPPGFFFTYVSSGWNEPVGTAFNTDGTKLFVWEKGGKVYVCNWDAVNSVYVKQATPVLNISPEVGNWRDHGLLGFALDPNFDINGLIYLMYVVDRHYLMKFGTGAYNAATNDYNSATIGRITRYATTMSGSNLVAVAGTRTILLGETKSTGIPILYESHGVGTLAFAADGTLLATSGDAASYINTDIGSQVESYYVQALTDGIIRANENVGAFRSQMLNSFDGKLFRLDPTNGNGVSSNPFYNAASPRSAQSRTYAFGLRNPFRMSIKPNTGSTNPATGDIGEVYVSEVGLDTYEELNIITSPGSNCGWPLYEGLTPLAVYNTPVVYNKDEPNPLYGIGGCTQQYFTFKDLLKQATADNDHTVYNPCNPSVAITSVNDNRFFHRLPVIDWMHYFDSARVAVFHGNNFTVEKVGTAASGVTGTSYRGNAAIAGTWYNGTMFPPQYQNTFFCADYGSNWIRSFNVQYTDKIQSVSLFETGTTAFTSIVHLSQNPLDGSLFCTDIGQNTINRVAYGGNQPPTVKMSSDKTYGAGPLSVQFTGSNSFDPEGGHLTYSWNFGDGSPLGTSANPTHNFTSGTSAPKKFVVVLTVKDSVNTTSKDSIIISINNTPPNVLITSPVNNSLYELGSDTSYDLLATVSDAEHTPAQLSYVWQTILRHNNHEHPQPLDTNKISSDLISRIGCNGDTYYWFIKLTVTDADGLSKVDSVKLLPNCGGPLPLSLVSFNVFARGTANLLTWVTNNEVNVRNFEIERSYDGANFDRIGSTNARGGQSGNRYEFSDNSFLDGYIYYRLKMIDNDGKFSRSLVVRVYNGHKGSNSITISPNPFKSEFLFGAVFSKSGNITLRIIDAKGTVVRTIKQQVNAGFNSFQVDKLDNQSKGVYFFEVVQDNEVRKTKLIKE